jgi:hydroxymethylpyrimidine pyrophosphatase-like HAD family hydrolase
MLAVDLDGNLDREDETCRSLLRQLRFQGLRGLAIVTAHPKYGKRVRALGAFYEVDYLVLENGSVILKRDGRDWGEIEKWLELHKSSRARLDSLRRELLQRCEIVERQRVDYTDPPQEMKTLRLPVGGGLVRLGEWGGSLELLSKAPLVLQQALSFARSLSEQLGLQIREVLDATSVSYGLASKGEGVEFVANLEGHRLFTVAMGDSLNDLSMLSTCDLSCAPANALPEVKQLVQSRNGILAQGQRIEAVKEVLRLLPKCTESTKKD